MCAYMPYVWLPSEARDCHRNGVTAAMSGPMWIARTYLRFFEIEALYNLSSFELQWFFLVVQ